MNAFARAFFIAVIITISAVAQQDTNAPPEALQPQEAQEAQEAQTAEHPEAARIQFLLDVSSMYFSENDPISAITACERILEIDPMNKQARYMASYAYISTKKYAKAEQLLKALIKEVPEDFELRNNLAWLYATAEDPAFRDGQKAVVLAQEAMVLAPIDHNVWNTLAEAYYSSGQYEKADRAMAHMASLAIIYQLNITQEMVDSYKDQIRKYKRSMDTEKVLLGDDDETSASLSVDEDAQQQQD